MDAQPGNLEETKTDVVVTTSEDGENVYASDKSWTDLLIEESIIRNLHLKSWLKPTFIQGAAIPTIMKGRNIVAQSKNGTGKTGAFVIGSLSMIDKDFPPLQAICISHTRELNQQNYNVYLSIANETGISVGIIQKGDRDIPRCHVLCTTQGSLLKLLKEKEPRVFDNVKVIVYDEADMMFQHEDNIRIIREVRKRLRDTQQVLFSATFDEKVMKFINEQIPNPVTIRIENVEDLTLENVDQYVIQCEHQQKFNTVVDIVRRVPFRMCIIFCNTKDYIHRLHQHLGAQGFRAHVIAAGIVDESVRDEVIKKIQGGDVSILLSTNVLSRGVDFRLVSLVINMDPPTYKEGEVFLPDPVTYLHRVGRTGRYGRRGVAVNLVTNAESQTVFRTIQEYYHKAMSGTTIDALVQRMEEVKADYNV
ncbi:unnamed protein product [Blepharisma stoltei]|uniref:ATP-dependent RNA helicase n=1 Tax=Blepharisma stoltei TaxID=1481888 RepID=A0AAU9K2F4_9CILI|nr:unnamed protein product [Blepharisma stoltei]